jgi:hypothetical protein
MTRAAWLGFCILIAAISLGPAVAAQEPALDAEHVDRECGFSLRYPVLWQKSVRASDKKVFVESPDPPETSVQVIVGPIKDWRISDLSPAALAQAVAAQNCLY